MVSITYTASKAASAARPNVAILVCTTVLGGHEFQAAALARDLARHVNLTVITNLATQRALFELPGVTVQVMDKQLLRAGTFPSQLLDGLRRRQVLRTALKDQHHVIVSAGAVEAGIAAGIALRGFVPTTLYLPSICDRVPLWGIFAGGIYNSLLAATCRLFTRIITVNRVQAKLIKAFSGVPTSFINNEIRAVAKPTSHGAGRLVFVGRLGEHKRVDELMEWLDFPDNPFNELLLIGDGPLRSALESQAKALRHLRCTFHGWLGPTEQDELLRSNDILLINSVFEGEPLCIREARARGMRVLARDIAGVRGVTLRSCRFQDRAGLRRLVASLSTDASSSLCRQTTRPTGTSDCSERRQRQLARLVASLHHV